uniref:Trehalose-phosphatase n=1 Tax=Physcomitrium patens TaxID=3218 RepID=A0A2K1JPT7_PHYPA|nr:hypothetical protein PHYPA_015928 [Physcomitrium patens]
MLTYGPKVLEVRPVIAWDKGKAVNYILNSVGLADSSDVFPMYIGDDRTDEDACKMLEFDKHPLLPRHPQWFARRLIFINCQGFHYMLMKYSQEQAGIIFFAFSARAEDRCVDEDMLNPCKVGWL